jgi:hypothetical protein
MSVHKASCTVRALQCPEHPCTFPRPAFSILRRVNFLRAIWYCKVPHTAPNSTSVTFTVYPETFAFSKRCSRQHIWYVLLVARFLGYCDTCVLGKYPRKQDRECYICGSALQPFQAINQSFLYNIFYYFTA